MHISGKKEIRGEKLRQVIAVACREKSRLKVTAGDDVFPIYSSILGLHDSLIVIDQFEPPETGDDLLVGSTLHLVFPLTSRGFFQGSATFVGKRPEVGEKHFVIKQPEMLFYLRERRVKRVAPLQSLPVVVRSIAGHKMGELVQVRNISTEGICLSFLQEGKVEPGDLLREVKLKLHGTTYFHADTLVRHTFRTQSGRLGVGLMWEPMSKPMYQTLLNYIKLVKEHHTSTQSVETSKPLFFESDDDNKSSP